MRITIATGGSRGDFQPYLALGLGFKAKGHKVRLLTYPLYESVVRERGLEFASLSGDPKTIVRALVEAGTNPVTFARCFREVVDSLAQKNLEETLWACRDADAVIYSIAAFLGYVTAEKLEIPVVEAGLQPTFSRTRYFPSSMASARRNLGGLYNLLSYALTEQIFWQAFRPMVNRVREEGGLPPWPLGGPFGEMRRRQMLGLYGWSPSVLPKPLDWGERLQVTGYWFLDRPPGWEPPKELLDFLESGPQPVAVGFSSVSLLQPEELLEKILGALRLTGTRAVLLSGWSGISNGDLPDEVLKLNEVPHDWLFARVRAAVHHGGAGTTAAALRAGIPMATLTFSADQTFWGHRAARLGVGTQPIARRKLSSERLAAVLRQVTTDEAMRQQAASLGAKIRHEDGVGRAVEAFERYAEDNKDGRRH